MTWNRIVFGKIGEDWHLPNELGEQLLGPEDERDERERLLMRINLRLHDLYRDRRDIADRWPTLPNNGWNFDGQSPVKYMVAHGLDGMREVLERLDRTLSEARARLPIVGLRGS